MADIQSNINLNIDTSAALANIKALQAQLSALYTSMSKGGAAAAARSADLQQSLINTINTTGKFSAQIKTIQSTTETFSRALEKNSFSMGEYFRYAGASTKTFGKVFKSEFDTINKVARERVKDLQTQYVKLGRDSSGAMKSIAVRPLTLDMENLGTKTAIAAQKQQLFNQLIRQGSTNLLNWGKNTQWAGRQLMVGFSIPLGIAGTMAAREFMKLEEQAIRFKRVYGDTFTPSAEADGMIDQIRDLALEFTKYGASIEETMGIAADAAAMGLQGADLTAQVAQATRLSILGGVEQTQALETTISLTNAFGVATEELATKTNFLNAVENQTMTSIEDLTIAIPKAGPVVQQLGGDVEDLAFFLTAMREGGINASESANALKSGLAALINPTQKAKEMLGGFGINLQGIVDTNKGDVKGIVVDFAQALDALDPLNRAQAIEQLFGKFQFARLSTLFQNVIAEGSQASRVLELTNATTAELGVLAERELKRVEDSPLYKFRGAVEEFKGAIAPIGEIFMSLVTPFIEFGTNVLNRFNELDSGVKSFITSVVGIAGGIAPIVIMSIGLIANFIASTIKAFATLSNMFGRAGKGSTILGQQIDYMTTQQLEAAAVAASLNQVHSTLTQQFTSEATAVRNLSQAYEQAILKGQAFSTIPIRPGASAPATKKKFASGGMVSGPGTGTSDSIPAMLSNGEAVIPADSVRENLELVKSLISGNLPKFAVGGFAGMLGRSRIATRTKGQTLLDMLLRGDTKYRGGLETGTGLDLLGDGTRSQSANSRNKDIRELLEQKAFGLDPSADASLRPTFGSVATTSPIGKILNALFGGRVAGKQFNQVTNPLSESLDVYGDVSMIGKRGLSKKATAYYGDTFSDLSQELRNPEIGKLFGDRFKPVSMRGGKEEDYLKTGRLENLAKPFGNNVVGYTNEGKPMYQQNNPRSYIEAHTAGGFDLKDIKTIISKNPEMIPLLRNALQEQGLKTKVRGPRTGILAKILGYARGGIVKGPGTETSDSILSLLSKGEAVIPAKEVRENPELIKSLISGGIPGFNKGFLPPIPRNARQVNNPYATHLSHFSEAEPMSGSKLMDHAKDLGATQEKLASIQKVIDSTADGVDHVFRVFDSRVEALDAQFNLDIGEAGSGKTVTKDRAYEELVTKGDQARAPVRTYMEEQGVAPEAALEKSRLITERVKNQLDALGNDVLLTAEDINRITQTAYTAISELDADVDTAHNRMKAGVVFADPTSPRASKAQRVSATSESYLGKRNKIQEVGGLDRASFKLRPGIAQNLGITEGQVQTVYKQLSKDTQAALMSLRDDVSGFANLLSEEAARAGIVLADAIDDASLSSSPSRRAIEASGRNIVEGALQPIENADVRARAAGQDIANDIVDGAATATPRGRGGKGRASRPAGPLVIPMVSDGAPRAEKVGRRATLTGASSGGSGRFVKDPVSGNIFTEEKYKKQLAAREEARRRLDRMQENQSAATQKPSRLSRFGASVSNNLGKLGVAGGTAGMGLMMASQIGGPAGEIAGAISGPLMAISALGPMLGALPPQVQIAGLALAAVGAVAYKMYDDFKKFREGLRDAAMATATTKKSLDSLAEAAGTVNPSDVANEIRVEQVTGADISGLEGTFGGQYLESETGKQYVAGIEKALESDSAGQVAQKLGNQIALSVASGILSMDQARSMAINIGAELNNMDIAVDINGKLQELLGPNGENLLEGGNLEVLANIITETGVAATRRGSSLDYLANAPVGEINRMFDQENIVAAEVEAAAEFLTLRTQSQQSLDALLVSHNEKVKKLTDQGDVEGIKAAQEEYTARRKELLSVGVKQSQDFLNQVKAIEEKTAQRDTYGNIFQGQQGSAAPIVNEVRTAVKELFEGDETAKKAIDAIEKQNLSAVAELTFLADLQTGATNPEDITKVIKLLDEPQQEIIANFNVTLGADASALITKVTALFGTDEAGKESARKFVIGLEAASDGDTEKALTALDEINRFAQIGNFQLNLDILNVKDLVELSDTYKDIEEAFAGGKQTLSYGINIAGLENFTLLAKDQQYFDTLDKEQQIEYLRTIKTVFMTRGSEEYKDAMKAWRIENKKTGADKGGWENIKGDNYAATTGRNADLMAEFEADLARQSAEASNIRDVTSGISDDIDGATETQKDSSFLDSIVEKLKRVQQLALGVADEWAKSKTIIENMFSGGADASPFQGLEQQMRKLGASEPLINLIAGMSPEEFEKRKNELFTFDAAGNITAFRGTLLSIGAAVRSLALGDFQNAQQATIATVNDQSVAIRKLVAAGISSADAFEMVKDTQFAAAIAGTTNNKVIAETVKQAKQATKAQLEYNAAQALAGENAKVKDQKKILGFLQQNAGQYSDEQIEAILSNDNLQKLLLSGGLSEEFAKELQTTLNNAADAADLQIEIDKLTIKGMEKLFDDGFSKAMEAFAAQEKEIELRFDVKQKPLEDAIKAAREQISDIQNAPGGLDDLNADLERIGEQEQDINEKYEDRFDALDRISRINEQLSAQQKAQLTIADALTSGDISAAAAAAQEMRAQQSANAIANEREILQEAQKIELENITAQMGLTREQIEDRIRVIKMQILEIEESIIEPAEYQLELLGRQEEIEKESLRVLGLSRAEWENIKNGVDLAKTSSDKYKEAIQLALDIVEDMKAGWEEITKPKETIHTIIERRISENSGESSVGSSGNNNVGPTPAPPSRSFNSATDTPSTKQEYLDAKAHAEAEHSKAIKTINIGPGIPGTKQWSAYLKAREESTKWSLRRVDLIKIKNANGWSSGGMIPSYLADGGMASMFSSLGTDTVPAMLTPGEFVIKRQSVKDFGVDNLKAINSGTYNSGSVYNYDINVNVKSDSDANDIARTVIAQIKQIDSRKVRGNRF